MSIQDEVSARVDEGRLVEFATFEPVRHLFLLPHVFDLLSSQFDPDGDAAEAMSEVQIDLENFITNGAVTVAFEREPKANFRRLQTRGRRRSYVWEIRTVSPKPGFRLFGLFADANTFIGVDLVPRDECSSDFGVEIRAANTAWANLFNPYKPLFSEKHDDYITQNSERLHRR